MADEPARIAKPAAWWGTILAAARERATTAQVWQAIRDYSAQAGVALPPNLFMEVNRMRGLASGLRRASDVLGRSRPDQAITGRMLGQQIYARDPFAQSLAPSYHVRFEMTTRQAGRSETGWYTLQYDGVLPNTVGRLMDDVLDYATGLSGGYGVEFGGVGTVEIGAW